MAGTDFSSHYPTTAEERQQQKLLNQAEITMAANLRALRALVNEGRLYIEVHPAYIRCTFPHLGVPTEAPPFVDIEISLNPK